MNTPYSNLDERAFWRTAIAERPTLEFLGLYRRKFPIVPTDRVVTAGSCFAQHIAKALRKNGFNFCDFEPAPRHMRRPTKAAYNYGVYSARYCNIYTVRQLLQTFERAFGERTSTERAWQSAGGMVDPFRPALEPVPFEDEAEMLASRASHLRSVRRVFEECDVFIFTLGLTEAWVSREDGSVFPLCPGTSGGTFDAAKYGFVNFTTAEVANDLRLFVAKLRAINPNVRILLTVSPVPLVATASCEHVLAATTYSKSVLRAVAGEISQSDPGIDYFPSFEMITSPATAGRFFKDNMRSVTPKGVAFVMRHFLVEHAPAAETGSPTTPRSRRTKARKNDGTICEEMLLEQNL